MTAASSPAENSRLRPVVSWISHQLGWLWALALVCDVAARVDSTLLLVLIECAADVLVVVGMVADMWHPRLCTRCADRVPLDPQRMVFRRLRLLRTYHQLRSGWLWLVCMIVAVAALAPALFWPTRAWGFEVIYVWSGVTWTLAWMHHPLRPWCPFCRRWDDGGDPERVPIPPPVEVGTRT